MARFGITSGLCTVNLLPGLNFMVFLSLYRVDDKPGFTVHERRPVQLLLPHMTAVLSANWLQDLDRARANT